MNPKQNNTTTKPMEQDDKLAIEWLRESLATAKSVKEMMNILSLAALMEWWQIADAYDAGYLDGTNQRNTTAEEYYSSKYVRHPTNTDDL